MSFEQLVEKIIEEAIERREFDDLPGKGKPINLDAYFSTPESLRVGYSILKNAGFVPAEVQLLQEINTLKDRLDSCHEETEKAKIRKALNDKTLKLAMWTERMAPGRGGGREK